jgi:hypothetical protein
VELALIERAYTKDWPEGIKAKAKKGISTEPSVLVS